MRERNFSISSLAREVPIKKENTRLIIRQLEEMESQAIALVRVFNRKRFLTIDQLSEIIEKQKVGAVLYSSLLAFLAGYLAAETIDSEFDVSIFGEMSIAHEGKSISVKAAMVALLNLIELKGGIELRDRRVIRKNVKKNRKKCK